MKEADQKKSILRPSVLKLEVIQDQSVFEDVWLPIGDDKEADVAHLIAQGRIRKG
ncbi:Uncharacterized [Syntrophomonas zehnderi OL-4]|uniref:Uncharacterized n=1 Tax=Syntrophomonas zehnderi OL-4 TaxID=690567 RepID=A0A0E3W393_9FIRM|nr:hypothetical protein [Syntrophomonas zehnderi]CFX63961.1 Uncharacterized [Syntrophomonas zehnderi OL-4]